MVADREPAAGPDTVPAADPAAEPVQDAVLEPDEPADTPLTLRPSSLTAIFFGLAMVGALFCGVGYLLGRQHAAVPPSRAAQPFPVPRAAQPPVVADGPKAAPGPSAPAVLLAAREEKPSALHPAPIEAAPQPGPAPALLPQSAAAPAGPMVTVQVAALTHESDAEALAATLRGRGFAAYVKTSDLDALYRVQLGPFSRPAALEVKRHLLTAGYPAVLK